MTRFLDGPAEGKTLMLRRAPHFLRVVRNTKTLEWDALDQMDDTPRMDEAIFVYELQGEASWMHIRARSGGGVYRGGSYRFLEPQPPDDVLRSTTKWREWAAVEFAKRGHDAGS